jgi:GxxExxY protein
VGSPLSGRFPWRFSITVSRYRLDLVVGELVIVEVKAVAKVLPIHRAQLMTYLKLLKLRIGLIINFNVTALRLGIYRIIQG